MTKLRTQLKQSTTQAKELKQDNDQLQNQLKNTLSELQDLNVMFVEKQDKNLAIITALKQNIKEYTLRFEVLNHTIEDQKNNLTKQELAELENQYMQGKEFSNKKITACNEMIDKLEVENKELNDQISNNAIEMQYLQDRYMQGKEFSNKKITACNEMIDKLKVENKELNGQISDNAIERQHLQDKYMQEKEFLNKKITARNEVIDKLEVENKELNGQISDNAIEMQYLQDKYDKMTTFAQKYKEVIKNNQKENYDNVDSKSI